jgi:ribosomal protein S18 acetylase RimI-like enzyme
MTAAAGTLRIRAARPSDAPSLAALSGELGYPAEVDIMRGRLEAIGHRPTDIVLVAELSPAGLVGWIHAAEQAVLEYGQRAEILGLVVSQDVRQHGIGRGLVAAVERWASDRGLVQISVRSAVTREASHLFYQRLGYRRIKTQHAYRKSLGPG